MPISTGLGLFLAMALNRPIRLIGVYRTAILAPFIASVAAQGVLFSFIFDQRFGVANALLDNLGLARQGFLGDPDQALFVIVLIGIWGGIGFPLVIYLAALQDVPRELIDAAAVDGARRWSVLRHVIMPQLCPVTIFLAVWQTLLSLQLFDLVYATTRGGPLRLDGGDRLLHLQPGLRALQRRLCGRGRHVRRLFLIMLVGAQCSQPPPRRGARDVGAETVALRRPASGARLAAAVQPLASDPRAGRASSSRCR